MDLRELRSASHESSMPRVQILQSDRDRAFAASTFQEALTWHCVAHHVTRGYDPQANGIAENTVKLYKELLRRNSFAADLPFESWNYVLRFVNDCLLNMLGRNHVGPRLGARVIARMLRPSETAALQPKGVEGRLLFLDSRHDGSCFAWR